MTLNHYFRSIVLEDGLTMLSERFDISLFDDLSLSQKKKVGAKCIGKKKELLPRFELGYLDSESNIITS